MDEDCGYVILFCGLPGTLKTFISTRLASKLGFCYLPTSASGKVSSFENINQLEEERYDRYQKVGHILKAIAQLNANIIIDGGFPTYEARRIALKGHKPNKAIIIYCNCSSEEQRIERLKIRMQEQLNFEAKSAKAIIDNYNNQNHIIELPGIDLSKNLISGYIDVDTSNYTINQKGIIPKIHSNKLSTFISDAIEEFSKLTAYKPFQQAISKHFDQLAEDYDTSTVWRTDSTLLQSIREELPVKPARVLDIGTGTGIAGEWYEKQGHTVTGIDISPEILKRASEKLSIVVLGNISKTPFLSEYYDLAIVRQSLHYFEVERSFKEINRIIKPDGLLAVSCIVVPDENAKTLWAEFKNVTQPLRLRVFTEEDITNALDRFQFKVTRIIHNTITRTEKVSNLEKRASNPLGGWVQFLKNFEKLINKISPQINFTFEKESLSYNQFWVTIWGKKKRIN